MAGVWDNRVVSDDAINRCISILRQILTPEDKNAYIETVVRKGYIAHFPPAPTPENSDGARPPRRTPVVLIAFGAFAAMAALSIVAILLMTLFTSSDERPVSTISTAPTEEIPVVAVLPLVPSSDADDSEILTNAMHNDLLTQLAKLQSLRVISSTSVQEYRGIERNLRIIGQELGADVILEGKVQIALDQIRIKAQLVDA